MSLVNLAPGITVRPEKVDFILVEKQPVSVGTGYTATVVCDRQPIVGLAFDTPAEAEQCVDDWTAKLNGDKSGTRVPIEDLDAKAGQLLDDILAELRETSCAIGDDLDRMLPAVYVDMVKRLHAVTLKHHGGTA